MRTTTLPQASPLLVLFLTSLLLTACDGSETETDSAGTVDPVINDSSTSASPGIISDENDSDDTDSQQADNSYFYFSYDDSASTASRDLSFFYLEQGLLPQSSWGRPYEFLNAESFGSFNSQTVGPFEISMSALPASASELMLDSTAENYLAVGIDVQGPQLSQAERKNLVLTLLVDTSGSMQSAFYGGFYETIDGVSTRLDLLQYGLDQLRFALKPGDVVNLVEFNTSASVVLENWLYSQQSTSADLDTAELADYFEQLSTNGSTNLDAGVQLAYDVALQYYDADKANRVVIMTDAYANTGETDTSVIANNILINDMEGIYFSGIGIGSGFDEDFLNELTDAGKGSYSAMVTPADATRLFGDDFMRFVDVAVHDVLFKLDYPDNWQHVASAAEERSTEASDIQTINYAYNSEQFFFEAFSTDSNLADSAEVTLQISWTDDAGISQQDSLTLDLASMQAQGLSETRAAAAVTALANLIAGSISCDQVQDSGLLLLTDEHPTLQNYQDAIEQFCLISQQ
ncbi:vWA domain-containing protein [Oceanobacter mangrovi]|uniref:vWA domain-containing protein n=1 Tax=Oceanobacter mangrovi TaxID=2862510 RepID=UPI001C8DC00E|nr:VWA domain-containing protein [Oceanobacter mangrovi]